MSTTVRRALLLSVVAWSLLSGNASAKEPSRWKDTIREALTKKVSLELKETPLRDVAVHLTNKLGIPIVIDRRALADVGLTDDEPITLQVSDISARAALATMLRELDLDWTLRHEVLLLTTEEVAENLLETRIYDVGDLVIPDGTLSTDDGWRAPGAQYDFDSLISLITSCVESSTWDEVGGPGSIYGLDVAGVVGLTVTQIRDVHEQIETLFGDLRRCRDKRAAPPMSDSLKAIHKALDTPIRLESFDTPLSEVLDYIRSATHIPILVELRDLEDVGLTDKEPVRIQLSDVTLKSALSLMLKDLDLTWIVRDEQLVITTHEVANNELTTKVYDISDLPAYRDEQGRGVPNYEALIRLITVTVDPQTWEEVGGWGSIYEFEAAGIQAIVISQTWQGHREIAALLKLIRKLRGKPLDEQAISKLPLVTRGYGMGAVFEHMMGPDGQMDAGPSHRTVLDDPNRDLLVADNNRFAFDLYGKLHGRNDGNVLFSPASVSACMAMIHAGARGETAREIGRGMRFSLSQSELHPAFASLLRSLPRQASDGCELRMANRLWTRQGIELVPDFMNLTREQFGAEIQPIDLTNRNAAVETINGWIAEQTARKIPNLLGPTDLNDETVLVAANAVYFNGQWTDPFKAKDTRTMPFHGRGRTVDVPMMFQSETCGYAAHDDFQLLEKTYGNGDLSMIVVLPKEGPDAMDALERSLTEKSLREWEIRLRPRQVNVFLPKFEFRSRFHLSEPLKQLGIREVFDRNKADLSGIAHPQPLPLFLQKVIHEATIEVDERGTEAAAATGMMGGMGGMGDFTAIPTFRADRPFLFLIRDKLTGSVLFLGRFNQPAE